MIAEACDGAMSRKGRYVGHHALKYWWTQEIAELRKKALKARRLYLRAHNQPSRDERHDAYKDASRNLKRAIKERKRRCFKELLQEVDIDPWGRGYRVIMAKIKGKSSPTLKCPNLLREIIETLFPSENEPNIVVQRIRDAVYVLS